VERFHYVIHHTHELVIRGGRMHELRYKVIDGSRCVVQTERKRCRGVPGEVFWGERFSPGKLCHDVGE
jgi:hypothetical protein